MNPLKQIYKLLDLPIPKAKCWNCNSPIFNMDSTYRRMGLCVYCYFAYKMGRESITDKYPEQVLIKCQTCGNITTCRDRMTEIVAANKTALCCKKPDYLYYIKGVK